MIRQRVRFADALQRLNHPRRVLHRGATGLRSYVPAISAAESTSGFNSASKATRSSNTKQRPS